MDVDLIDFLGKISSQVIVHYPDDWKFDIGLLEKNADSMQLQDKRLYWHVSSYGTHLLPEREVFIKDTTAFNFWVNYRPNDPDMFGYFIEITERGDGNILGNVYEVGNYAEHAQYVRENSMPIDAVTLDYSYDWGVNAGKRLTISRSEYDNDRHHLMSESGNVRKIEYHTENDVILSQDLHDMRSEKMNLATGVPEIHLQQLSERLAEIRNPHKETPITTDSPKTKAQYKKSPEKQQSFEDILKSAQEKANKINNKNALNTQETKDTGEVIA